MSIFNDELILGRSVEEASGMQQVALSEETSVVALAKETTGC